jgi:hypothetical protein
MRSIIAYESDFHIFIDSKDEGGLLKQLIPYRKKSWRDWEKGFNRS